MKTIKLLFVGITLVLIPFISAGQTIYTYPLTGDFSSVQPGGPDLLQIMNDNGQTGEFTTRAVPPSTCGQGGTAGGYFFADDAGLQFNNPEGFIDQTYSLAFNFQIDEFIDPPSWVRILSFTHFDDIGVYIYLTNPPVNGTLEFWPYGTVGEWDFFNTTDFYQLILVRTANGMITIYINGQEFATYDDSETQKFVPAPPNNFIVFFRDDPSVLEYEASPGFVSSIIIRNLNWTAQEVEAVWDNFCSSLLTVDEPEVKWIRLYPNPVDESLHYELPDQQNEPFHSLEITDIFGRAVVKVPFPQNKGELNLSDLPSGTYMVRVKTDNEVMISKILKR